jgi:ABC-type proline/glycine betaine transport system permease subunit
VSGTDVLIWVAGIAGVAAFAFGLGSLVVGGIRRRRPLEIVLGVGVTLAAIWFLVAYGDRLLR